MTSSNNGDDRHGITRRTVLKGIAAGAAVGALGRLNGIAGATAADGGSDVFRVKAIPADPFTGDGNRHAGFDALLDLMAASGFFFHRSTHAGPHAGPGGMIAAGDVVLVKVNAQWKYRGATNTDLVRGIVQAVLDHPAGFHGEVVIVENGQGRGSLSCDTSLAYGDTLVRANAEDPSHSFSWLVRHRFADPRVSKFLLDPIRDRFIASGDHATDGYRRWRRVSFPCFTTRGGRRVELRGGVWRNGKHRPTLKLINVPVLKTHGGCELTGAVKHVYGLLSMKDGRVGERHYDQLGRACGQMLAGVRAPVLNVVDAIWVSQGELAGHPPEATTRVDQLMASQDPVALDYLAAKEILHPIDGNPSHHPSAPSVWSWLTQARDTINALGGLHDAAGGLLQGAVTLDEALMRVHETAL